MKIAIIGYSGSGKSTLAAYLGELYKIPVLHMDRVRFLPNWVERDKDDEAAIVEIGRASCRERVCLSV